jgi:hypothetical protein
LTLPPMPLQSHSRAARRQWFSSAEWSSCPAARRSPYRVACAMEASKLVTAGWLARRWRATAWVWRLVLVALVAGLAVINAAGVYVQLVAAHAWDRGGATLAVDMQEASLAARIDVASHKRSVRVVWWQPRSSFPPSVARTTANESLSYISVLCWIFLLTFVLSISKGEVSCGRSRPPIFGVCKTT